MARWKSRLTRRYRRPDCLLSGGSSGQYDSASVRLLAGRPPRRSSVWWHCFNADLAVITAARCSELAYREALALCGAIRGDIFTGRNPGDGWIDRFMSVKRSLWTVKSFAGHCANRMRVYWQAPRR
jgi:hypothetical protein